MIPGPLGQPHKVAPHMCSPCHHLSECPRQSLSLLLVRWCRRGSLSCSSIPHPQIHYPVCYTHRVLGWQVAVCTCRAGSNHNTEYTTTRSIHLHTYTAVTIQRCNLHVYVCMYILSNDVEWKGGTDNYIRTRSCGVTAFCETRPVVLSLSLWQQ